MLEKIKVFFSRSEPSNLHSAISEKITKEIDPEPLLSSQAKVNTQHNVIHQNESFLIYLTSTNDLGWKLNNIPDKTLLALREFIFINGLIGLHMNRLNKKSASIFLANRLYYCLTTKEQYDAVLIFKEVKDYVNSFVGSIKKRVIETPRFSVYLSRNNNIDWWYYQDIPEYMVDALEEFEVLKELSTTTLPQSYKYIVMNKLASALANAFNKDTNEKAKDCFRDVRKFLISKSESFLKLKLFLISISFSLLSLITVIFLCIYLPSAKIYAMGIGAGVIGAMVSSLQRNSFISLDSYAGEYSLYCESFSRIIIGAVFGCFLVFGIKSEIFLAPFKSNLHAIICFCFISGFVERFVPELINSVVKKNEQGSQS
ncbi:MULTISPECIES: hypothetical protein [Rahnella]|uniref:Uncharacterized protein n=1 Tax=Rahnella laticis TaxID=2787622 RepID=A0ABS0E5U0_9GAMM|nr:MULTISPECIES: hypothetical protein [Rahnella]MBF7980467.1 hypothetical protein [Rahnella laticis]MBF8000273.1 hypothetical protein [Rahnella sp. LAC-M12]